MTTTALDDVPALSVELCLNGTGALTAASVWTTVDTYVRGFGVQSPTRDRDTSRYNGGSVSLTVDNRDQRFNPANGSSPYSPNLKPRVQGRIRATWLGVTYPVAYFYVDSWPQTLPQGMYDAEVPITASDGFRLLNSSLPDSVWAIKVAELIATYGGYWYRLGEQSGTAMADSSGNATHGRYEGGATFNHRQTLLPYGIVGGAIEFNGSDMVGVVPLAALGAGNDWSACFWTRMPDEVPDDEVGASQQTLYRQDRGLEATGGATDDPNRWRIYLEPVTGGLGSAAGSLVLEVWNTLANPRWSDSRMEDKRVYCVGATYDESATTALLYIDGDQQTAADSGRTGLSVSTKGEGQIGGIGGPSGVNPYKGTIGEFVLFPTQLLTGTEMGDLYDAGANPWDGDDTGTRVGRVLDAIGWPAGLRDLDTGLSTLGPALLEGTALDYLQLLARTEDGLLYCAPDGDVTFVSRSALRSESRFTTSAGTFSDRTGSLLYENITFSGADDESIINVARCSRVGGTVQEYRDQTSIDLYGERAWDGGELLLGTDGEAYDRAAHQVLRYKDPAVRVTSITLRPRGTTALWPHVLGRLVGDRITVEANPLQTGATSDDYYITGITHQISDVYTIPNGGVGFDWVTVWTLEPTDPNESFWAVAGSGAAKNQVDTAKASF